SVAALSVRPPPTVVRAVEASGLSGGTVAVPLEVVAQGFEHVLEFSLGYPTGQLTFQTLSLAPGLPDGTSLVLKTNGLASGRVGISIVLPDGVSLAASTHALASVAFRAGTVSSNVSLTISFEDQPIARHVRDAAGQELLAGFQPAQVHLSPTRVEILPVDA